MLVVFKNSAYIFSVLFLLFGFVSTVHAEIIRSYDVEIQLHSDSSFDVTERIVYDFERADRHGIFRFIPTQHPQESSGFLQKRYLDVDLTGVTMDGATVPYDLTEDSSETRIKIGDPDKTITGPHTYEISYTVHGGLSYFEDGTVELNWNVTGNEWPVTIESATVELSADDDLLTGDRACYRGQEGDTSVCGDITESDDQTIVYSDSQLSSGAGLTIAHEVDGNVVATVVLERTEMIIPWIVGLLLWFGALITFVYRYRTEYKTGRSIIAQYEPYANMKPMFTGVLFDGRLDSKDITAGLVYLAEQGFIKIAKTESKVLFFFEVDDYEVTLIKTAADAPTSFLREVLSLLFGESASVGSKISLAKLAKSISDRKRNQKILKKLKKDLEKDLEASGFFQINIPIAYILAGAFAAVWAVFFLGTFFVAVLSEGIIFFMIGSVGSVIILAFMYRRRTRKGYEALDHLKGFKQFLSVTEKERYAFHNAPAKSPEQFMQYLPYAIAFGVEEKWAEVFKDITIVNPDWYDGGSSHASFSATNLTTSLGAFSTAFASSSGTSASSGGGSSGGGGGGGGGGSW